MCSPVAIPMAMSVVGGSVSAVGAIRAGRDQERYYNFLGDQAEAEAAAVKKQGDQTSSFIQDQGLVESLGQRRTEAATVGAEKAAIGQNGTGGSVTSEDILRDTTTRGALDRAAIRYNSDVRSWDAVTQADYRAWDLESTAKADRMAAGNARRTGNLNAFTSILGSATQAGNQWYMSRGK